MHPINLKYPIPIPGDPGYFGAIRRFDIHTGIDLYCDDGDPVVSIEDGIVVAIEAFTGEHADSPWWNDTWALLIEGNSGVICYGEIVPLPTIKVGSIIPAGLTIGHVKPVLKQDKGKNPPSMLHLELYTTGTRQTVWWKLGEECPENLLNPIQIIYE